MACVPPVLCCALRPLLALAVPFLAGFLCSGSCFVVACSEDCDPCYSQCKCNDVCTHPLGGASALRIVACESRVATDGPGRTVRTVSGIAGPALGLFAGPGPHAPQDLARFARGVLEHNPELFPTRPGARWALDGVDLFETAGVVSFHQDIASASDGFRTLPASSVSLLVDRRGTLVEASQVFAR